MARFWLGKRLGNGYNVGVSVGRYGNRRRGTPARRTYFNPHGRIKPQQVVRQAPVRVRTQIVRDGQAQPSASTASGVAILIGFLLVVLIVEWWYVVVPLVAIAAFTWIGVRATRR